MIITLNFYKRRPGMTWEEFSHYWRNVHGPLVRTTPQTAKYIRRYVQHHIRRDPQGSNELQLDCDGFSEVWYDSEASRAEMKADPLFAKIMLADEEKFLDMKATRVSVYDDQVVQIGPAPVF